MNKQITVNLEDPIRTVEQIKLLLEGLKNAIVPVTCTWEHVGRDKVEVACLKRRCVSVTVTINEYKYCPYCGKEILFFK